MGTYSTSCDDDSPSPATTTLTTADVASKAEPNPDSTPLLAPRAPTHVLVTVSNNTASISCTAPVDDTTHCGVIDYSVTVEYRSDSGAEDKVQDCIESTTPRSTGLYRGTSTPSWCAAIPRPATTARPRAR